MPKFEDIEIALTDINAHNLDMITEIIRRIVSVNRLKSSVTSSTDRREACAGINHQTWYLDTRHGARKIGREELTAAFERHPAFSVQEKARIDVLKRFGF